MDAAGDARDLDTIREICLGFPEVEETELQDRPLFRVHRRRQVAPRRLVEILDRERA